MTLADLDLRGIPAWVTDAPCGSNPALFTADKLPSGDLRLAKAVCAECPVRDLCLTAAIERAEPVGIWGGLTARERARIETGPRTMSHGTRYGARTHRNRGEKPCTSCADAERVFEAERRAARKAARP